MRKTVLRPDRVHRDLASVPDAAAYVGVHPNTLRRWIASGRLTGYSAGPRLIRVDLAELDAMLTVREAS